MILPKLRQLLDKIEVHKAARLAAGQVLNQSNTRELFALLCTTYLKPGPLLNLTTMDDVVYNGTFPVPIRIYLPATYADSTKVLVYLHGGGHMCGSIAAYDPVVRNLVKYSNHIIVAVDYRLSPESPYPVGLEDCKAAIRGLAAVLRRRGINWNQHELGLIGDSAGAALCASLIMDKEFVAVEQITQQVLIYPSLDYTLSSPSIIEFANGYLLDKVKIEWYFNHYFQNHEDRRKASPLYGEFYAKMPATMVIVAGFDPLRDEGVLYYNNVLKVGARAELLYIENVIHAYLMLDQLCEEECQRTYQEISSFLAT
jgi:acetyl esterase